jgi:hypothetical protein
MCKVIQYFPFWRAKGSKVASKIKENQLFLLVLFEKNKF